MQLIICICICIEAMYTHTYIYFIYIYTLYIHTVYKSYHLRISRSFEPGRGRRNCDLGDLSPRMATTLGISKGKMMMNPRGAGWITSYYTPLLIFPGVNHITPYYAPYFTIVHLGKSFIITPYYSLQVGHLRPKRSSN